MSRIASGSKKVVAGVPRTRNAAETRARILEATTGLLVESGYAKTSTWAVCARANVSRGALLHHFPTRLHLLIGAVAHLAQAPLNELDAALATATPRQQVGIFLNWLWATLEGDLFAVGLELLTAARTEHELRNVIRAGGDALQERLKTSIGTIVEANGHRRGGQLEIALLMSVPSVRGIGLDLSVGGDRSAHELQFGEWRRSVESLVA